ncbi:LIM domain kinase 1-like isoform X2 [Corticium candelabrum]|uniref:LIM domain kinase 1-like isoform X2 n=1 Tax=Corticium candelabrum TaxID=121492 RepID=UPI002E26FA0B|nr:LIM domain kinase 1-like isoform X2 [Corticium candelabrum]
MAANGDGDITEDARDLDEEPLNRSLRSQARDYLEVLHHQKLQDGTEVREERLLAINGYHVRGQSLKEIRHQLLGRTKSKLTIEYGFSSKVDEGCGKTTDDKDHAADDASSARQNNGIHLSVDEAVVKRRRPKTMPTNPGGRLKLKPKVVSPLGRAQSVRISVSNQMTFRADEFEFGEILGKGFFGQVHKVRHKKTGEIIVLKELLNIDKEAQDGFIHEIHLLQHLEHRNVLKFVGFMFKDNEISLLTEFISGGTLIQKLEDKAAVFSWKQRALFARDISAGMAYLHDNSVIHRDLTSHNCLIREDTSVVVADFGLARVFPYESTHGPSFNRRRMTVVGSPYWMAPEMMKGEMYDERVDIFSFGIVLCEIIGRVNADPDFLPRTQKFGVDEDAYRSSLLSDCPELFFQFALRCAHVSPDERPTFQSCESWLNRFIFNVGSESITSSPSLDSLQNRKFIHG